MTVVLLLKDLSTALKPFERATVVERAELYDSICNTSTCIGTIDVHPESFDSALPQVFHLTITDQLQDQWKRDTAFSDTASKTVVVD